MPDPALIALARQITETLGESNPHLVRRVVEVLGAEAATAHLAEAQRIEAAGGELIASGKRRRTPGGVFFRVARAAATPEQCQAIGWPTGQGERQAPSEPRPPRPEHRIEPLPWDTRLAHLQALLDKEGIVNMSKITLTGRPGKLIEAQGCILTVMATDPTTAPTRPKGLPALPAKPTSYIVYIAARQWQKVAEAIKDPGDVLIIEGYPVFDERLPGLAVLTQNITTRNLQRAKREAESAGG